MGKINGIWYKGFQVSIIGIARKKKNILHRLTYKKKKITRQSGRNAKIHVTRQFFDTSGPRGTFFRKTATKNVFRYTQGECVYPMLGLCHFWFGQWGQ